MSASGRPAPAMDPSSQEAGDVPLPAKPLRDDARVLRDEIMVKLAHSIGKDLIVAQSHDWLVATTLAMRDRDHRSLDGLDAEAFQPQAQARLLSLGRIPPRPFVRGGLSNLGLTETVRRALAELGVDLDAITRGAGRRARQWRPWAPRRLLHGQHGAVEIPALGYGIRYDFGLFKPDHRGWLAT